MTYIVAPGDTIRITAADVTLLDNTFAKQPVINGLTGTVALQDWESGETVLDPVSIASHALDDWFVDVTAPAAGYYRIVAVIAVGGAQRTLYGELTVTDHST